MPVGGVGPEPLEPDPPPQPLTSDAVRSNIAADAVAKDQDSRRGPTCVPAKKRMTPAAASNAPKIQSAFGDECGSFGDRIGSIPERAVVVTETVAVDAALPLTVTLEGETEQVGPAGATLHFRVTVPLKPPVPANESG